MSRKARTTSAKRKPHKERKSITHFPALANGPTPAQVRAQLERQASARDIKAIDEAMLDAMAQVWPENENLDHFLSWLRQSRREGR